MFIYNVTTKVDWSINDAWVEWMQKEHMPAFLETNCFLQFRLLRLHDQDDEEGLTYVAQYFAESKASYNRYLTMHANDVAATEFKKWGDKFISFKTLLEVIE